MDPWDGSLDGSLRRAWQPTPVFLPGESPWTEEPGGLQCTGSPSVGSDLATEQKQEEETRPRGGAKGDPAPAACLEGAERAGCGEGESEGFRGHGRGSEPLGFVPAAPGWGQGKAPAGGQHSGARLRTDPVHEKVTAAQVPAAARAASPTGFSPGVLVPKRRRTGGEPAVSERPVPFSSSLAIPSLSWELCLVAADPSQFL